VERDYPDMPLAARIRAWADAFVKPEKVAPETTCLDVIGHAPA
jgi:hypothetical protein